jgi:hypothetical protein
MGFVSFILFFSFEDLHLLCKGRDRRLISISCLDSLHRHWVVFNTWEVYLCLYLDFVVGVSAGDGVFKIRRLGIPKVGIFLETLFRRAVILLVRGSGSLK